jgi:hypothetical protein
MGATFDQPKRIDCVEESQVSPSRLPSEPFGIGRRAAARPGILRFEELRFRFIV